MKSKKKLLKKKFNQKGTKKLFKKKFNQKESRKSNIKLKKLYGGANPRSGLTIQEELNDDKRMLVYYSQADIDKHGTYITKNRERNFYILSPCGVYFKTFLRIKHIQPDGDCCFNSIGESYNSSPFKTHGFKTGEELRFDYINYFYKNRKDPIFEGMENYLLYEWSGFQTFKKALPSYVMDDEYYFNHHEEMSIVFNAYFAVMSQTAYDAYRRPKEIIFQDKGLQFKVPFQWTDFFGNYYETLGLAKFLNLNIEVFSKDEDLGNCFKITRRFCNGNDDETKTICIFQGNDHFSALLKDKPPDDMIQINTPQPKNFQEYKLQLQSQSIPPPRPPKPRRRSPPPPPPIIPPPVPAPDYEVIQELRKPHILQKPGHPGYIDPEQLPLIHGSNIYQDVQQPNTYAEIGHLLPPPPVKFRDKPIPAPRNQSKILSQKFREYQQK